MTKSIVPFLSELGETRDSFITKMAKVKVAVLGHKKNVNCTEEKYEEMLKHWEKNYSSTYNKYTRDINPEKPNLFMAKHIALALECSVDRVVSYYNPEYYSLDLISNGSNRNIIDIERVFYNDSQRRSFKISKVTSNYKYEYDRGDKIINTKSFELQCLQDKLQFIPRFDRHPNYGSFERVRYDSEVFRIDIEEAQSFDNVVNLKFHKPLELEQTINISISYIFERIREFEKFGGTWVLHPTNDLIMDCEPRTKYDVWLGKGESAQVYVYKNIYSYLNKPNEYNFVAYVGMGGYDNFRISIPDTVLVGGFYEMSWVYERYPHEIW